MPRNLLRAHTEMNRAVEKCCRPAPSHSDRERVEHLFRLHEQLTAPLLLAVQRARTRRARAKSTRAPATTRPLTSRLPDQR